MFSNDSTTNPGYIEKQRAVLPETIPVAVMIDVGEGGDTALRKTMLAIVEPRPSQPYEPDYKFFWQDPDPQGWSWGNAMTVSKAKQWNSDPRFGIELDRWRIMNDTEWNTMVETKPDDRSAIEHLHSTFGVAANRHFKTGEVVWISTTPEEYLSRGGRHPAAGFIIFNISMYTV